MTPILIHNLPPERWKHFQYNSNSHYHHHYHLHHHHPHSCLITGDKASSSVPKYGHLSQELGILVQHWTHIFHGTSLHTVQLHKDCFICCISWLHLLPLVTQAGEMHKWTEGANKLCSTAIYTIKEECKFISSTLETRPEIRNVSIQENFQWGSEASLAWTLPNNL